MCITHHYICNLVQLYANIIMQLPYVNTSIPLHLHMNGINLISHRLSSNYEIPRKPMVTGPPKLYNFTTLILASIIK
uniref:Uncharacterized protein n=1 Tax=Arundo donax TaxID=35708 RepID=A0A0A9GZX3_ARUDO